MPIEKIYWFFIFFEKKGKKWKNILEKEKKSP